MRCVAVCGSVRADQRVTKLRTVDRERLMPIDKVGHLAPARVREVLNGLALVLGLDALGG